MELKATLPVAGKFLQEVKKRRLLLLLTQAYLTRITAKRDPKKPSEMRARITKLTAQARSPTRLAEVTTKARSPLPSETRSLFL